ncbi:MAG: DUF4352 domain-containing protein [Elusimicrobia bacterium]|nr:DUF4352 domain-containing protein [Elusimicrobiota bacterium]
MAKLMDNMIAIAVGGAVIGGVGYRLLPVRTPRAPATTAANINVSAPTQDVSRAKSNRLISFEDTQKLFKVQIHRTLIGQEVVDQGAFYDWQLKDAERMGKTIVYFDVSVTNQKASEAQTLSQSNFLLEDTKGNSYATEQARDYIRGDVHLGRSGRGGIGFYIYQDVGPAVLVYDTRYFNRLNNEKFYARSPRLDRDDPK